MTLPFLSTINLDRVRFSTFVLLLLSIPTQLGKHFWVAESLVLGRRIDYLSPTLYATDVLLVMYLLLTLFTRHSGKPKVPPESDELLDSGQARMTALSGVFRKFWVIGVVVLITQFSFLVSSSSLVWYFGARLALLVLFVKLISGEKNLDKTLPWIALCWTMVATFLAVWQFIGQSSVGGLWYFLGERTFDASTPGISQMVVHGRLLLRPYSMFAHPNVSGGFLTVLLPMFLFARVKNNAAHMIWKASGVLFSLLGIFLSFSRSSWAVTILLFIFFGIKNIISIPRWGRGVLVGVVVLFVVEELFLGRFGNLTSFETESVTQRQQLAATALKMFAASPILGQGIGQFIPSLPEFAQPPFLLQPVHSIYLLIASETGVVGTVLFLLLLYAAIQKVKKRRVGWVGVSLIAACLLGLFDHYFLTIKQTQYLLVLLIGLSLSDNLTSPSPTQTRGES